MFSDAHLSYELDREENPRVFCEERFAGDTVRSRVVWLGTELGSKGSSVRDDRRGSWREDVVILFQVC